ncbi:MAG: response regulator transcription factor [Burkholderiales bacterium]|nr:response regulator transcription factor [Burkholderiales bacterium]
MGVLPQSQNGVLLARVTPSHVVYETEQVAESTRGKTVRILLADDHGLVRAGIRARVQELNEVEVVGEAADGRSAIEMVGQLHPDMVLMDISMKGLNGIEATSQMQRSHSDVRVVILSMHSTEEHVAQALRAGASGYIVKDSATEELEIAIDTVMRGERYVSPTVSRSVVDRLLLDASAAPNPLSLLTPRQKEILQLIAEGRSTKEIAHVLGLSIKTVETHRAQLMQRLSIRDVPGLVRYALRAGLITND